MTFRRNTKEQPKMKIHGTFPLALVPCVRVLVNTRPHMSEPISIHGTVTKALTVLDVKKKMALKYQLPYPEEMGDSQSRMLRLQARSAKF